MEITKDKFVDRLIRSQLLSRDEVAECESNLRAVEVTADARSYALALVKAGRLTNFQALAIYQGRIKGLTFGDYVILDQLGKGGMGVVYKAQHCRMDRIVAIKVLPRQAISTKGAVDRFYREVKAAAKLMHPNIVAALDASEVEGLHYLVMEYVNGQDLSQTVDEHGPLSPEQAVDCIVQAARGLEFAHQKGVIHRDIKPANLLLDRNGTVKILDMGLARLTDAGENTSENEGTSSATRLDSDSALDVAYDETLVVSLEEDTAPVNEATRLTKAGQIMGTLDYMPPEQFTDTRGVDGRADIYSLGCTLYRLLTDRRPYPGETVADIFRGHNEAPIPSLRTIRPEIPQQLDAVFQKMLAKQPSERQASMAEVIAELESCVSPEHPPEPVLIETPLEDPLADLPDAFPETSPGGSSSATALRRQRKNTRRSRQAIAWTVAGSLTGALLILAIAVMMREPKQDATPSGGEVRQVQLGDASNDAKSGGQTPQEAPRPHPDEVQADETENDEQGEPFAPPQLAPEASEAPSDETPDVDADVAFILGGLTEVSTNGIPGELAVVGPHAFPVISAIDEYGTPHHLLAAARYGKGRLAVVTHAGFIVQESANQTQLARNLIFWTSNSDATQISRVIVARDSFRMGKQPLVEQGFQIVDLGEDNWEQMLSEADVIIVRALDLSDVRVRLLRDYVQQGGGLIAADPSWVWMQQHAKPGQTMAKDCPANRLLAPAGIEHLDQGFPELMKRPIPLGR